MNSITEPRSSGYSFFVFHSEYASQYNRSFSSSVDTDITKQLRHGVCDGLPLLRPFDSTKKCGVSNMQPCV